MLRSKTYRFPFIRPSIPPVREWVHYLEPAYRAKWFSNFGPVVRQFETQLTMRICYPDNSFLQSRASFFAQPCAGLDKDMAIVSFALLWAITPIWTKCGVPTPGRYSTIRVVPVSEEISAAPDYYGTSDFRYALPESTA